jgi:hypothetical protein
VVTDARVDRVIKRKLLDVVGAELEQVTDEGGEVQ